MIDDAVRGRVNLNERFQITRCFPLHEAADSPATIEALHKFLSFSPQFSSEGASDSNAFDILIGSEILEATSALLEAGARIKESPYWASETYKMRYIEKKTVFLLRK